MSQSYCNLSIKQNKMLFCFYLDKNDYFCMIFKNRKQKTINYNH